MEEGTKLENWRNVVLSAPSLDVEEYSKLRTGPFPQQSCTNLPYYFLEPELPGPRLTSSDLDVFPLEKLGERDADKLKRLYICLKEECSFKKYLVEEKRIGMGSVESNRVYGREISASDFRIRHIKDDIAQFTRYLTKAYNLNSDKFNSVVEAGLAAALSSCSMLNCFGLASTAISTGANFYLWVWMCILELLVVRMQTFLQLTLSNYADGTGFNTWSFCPYIKGLGMSLLVVQLVGGLATFWEAPLSLIKAWVKITQDLENCSPIPVGRTLLQPDENSRWRDNPVQRGKHCFAGPDELTRSLTCSPGTHPETFNSNYFLYFLKELTNMSLMNLTLNNGLLYLATMLLWFFMSRATRNGFHKLIQKMHRGPILVLSFLAFTMLLVAIGLNDKIAKEATYAFFSLRGNFFHFEVIMTATLVSLSQVTSYYLEMGSKLPFKWDPDAIFSWKATTTLSIYFLGMWISYLAIYNEKHFYNMKDISCISSEIYLMNSALPRFFDMLFLDYLGFVFFLLQAYTNFNISTTLVTIVWRNLSHNIVLLKKNPLFKFVFDLICLLYIILNMTRISHYKEYWDLVRDLKFMEAEATAVLTIFLVVAVVIFYGPTRLWVDLEFLTRRRIHPSLPQHLLVCLFVIMSLSVLGVPTVLRRFMTHGEFVKGIIICLLVGPLIVTFLAFLVSGEPVSQEVRNFHYWGERSERQQNERLMFNPAQFKTSHLRYKEFDMYESGDDFYTDQRKKALTRIALLLKNTSEE